MWIGFRIRCRLSPRRGHKDEIGVDRDNLNMGFPPGVLAGEPSGLLLHFFNGALYTRQCHESRP
jgi:hypothetical protein